MNFLPLRVSLLIIHRSAHVQQQPIAWFVGRCCECPSVPCITTNAWVASFQFGAEAGKNFLEHSYSCQTGMFPLGKPGVPSEATCLTVLAVVLCDSYWSRSCHPTAVSSSPIQGKGHASVLTTYGFWCLAAVPDLVCRWRAAQVSFTQPKQSLVHGPWGLTETAQGLIQLHCGDRVEPKDWI